MMDGKEVVTEEMEKRFVKICRKEAADWCLDSGILREIIVMLCDYIEAMRNHINNHPKITYIVGKSMDEEEEK